MGEVVNFPKAKRPLPAGHEDVEPPGLRALANAALVRLGKARAPTENGGDGPAARAADSPTSGAGGVGGFNHWDLATKDRCGHLVLIAA